jgi:PD-(D/E)XK nuclease superfamily protein
MIWSLKKKGQFLRLQCKAGRYENGVVKFNTCSVNWWNKTKKRYTREEIDYFAVYCQYTEKVYLVPVDDVEPNVGYLRVEPPANNQTKGVRWAEDFEMKKVMERE